MSSFRVQLDNSGGRPAAPVYKSEPGFDGVPPARRRRTRIFVVAGLTAVVTAAIMVAGGFLYFQTRKSTPQYSLALLVDAAKKDDKAEVATLVDINAVVDDFVPQMTDKAVELYGRGLPPQSIARVTALAKPLLPAVKERARAELPKAIRSRSEKYGNVPFFMMVFGADRYFDISVNGGTAVAKSRNADRPLELKMRWNGGRWQIVGLKDEQLATDIARRIGQEIIAVAVNGKKNTADKFGIGNLSDLVRQAEELVK
jgi:hypothetical protein